MEPENIIPSPVWESTFATFAGIHGERLPQIIAQTDAMMATEAGRLNLVQPMAEAARVALEAGNTDKALFLLKVLCQTLDAQADRVGQGEVEPNN